MRDEAELHFEAFVAARWHALVRTAFLLTGDHALAEDLVQTALVRTHRQMRAALGTREGKRLQTIPSFLQSILQRASLNPWVARLRIRLACPALAVAASPADIS